jgi:predicted lipoprotein with Yx(FWY)xxD motif
MSLSSKRVGALVLAIPALALAACGDEDGGNAGAAQAGAVVEVASVDGTAVLADADGRTLYSADVESGGRIRCTDGCTAIWLPVAASDAEASAAADETGAALTSVARPDGGRQLALDGAPLYAFAEEGPGEITGDGVTDGFAGTEFVWNAAVAPGGADDPAGTAPSSDGGGYGGGY